MILGGDLGGTKTLLALAEVSDGRLRIGRQQRYASPDYANFEQVLADFLADAPPVEAACFGVAGPTDGESARLTYLPWHLDAKQLSQRFKIGRVTLANDFAAAANGLPQIEPAQILTLHTGQPIERAPRVILGAGTGLGVAGLVWDSDGYRVIPGEGGHLGFAPQTPEQGELWRWLLNQNGRVTTEDIVSGPGLARIYAFLGGSAQQPESIGQAALAGDDPLAVHALELWLACYGAFAGDLALHWLARGGVYLAGGIAAKLLPHLDKTPFIGAFLAKREHAELVAAMPIHLLTAEDLGLRGALALAAKGK
jgi:glucokinase